LFIGADFHFHQNLSEIAPAPLSFVCSKIKPVGAQTCLEKKNLIK